MKGVVLAGGLGTRLSPLTKVTNKHLLPVYNKPMIYYPIEALVKAGVKDVLLVTGGQSPGEFMRLLKNGGEFGLDSLEYAYQSGEGGIAEALSLAESFCDGPGGQKFIVILGDNILQYSIRLEALAFQEQHSGARILLKKVDDPRRFGVAVFSRAGAGDIVRCDPRYLRGGMVSLSRIEEKPEIPLSDCAVIGIYMYDRKVFEYIKRLSPSGRGELEITDDNNFYIEDGEMAFSFVGGWWADAGTFDSLFNACCLVKETGANNSWEEEG